MVQYQREERALIANRLKSSQKEIEDILRSMENDIISTKPNIESLKNDLARHYKNEKFFSCKNMGGILRESLEQVLKK
jgi:predicted transcriptional regulator